MEKGNYFLTIVSSTADRLQTFKPNTTGKKVHNDLEKLCFFEPRCSFMQMLKPCLTSIRNKHIHHCHKSWQSLLANIKRQLQELPQRTAALPTAPPDPESKSADLQRLGPAGLQGVPAEWRCTHRFCPSLTHQPPGLLCYFLISSICQLSPLTRCTIWPQHFSAWAPALFNMVPQLPH